MKTPTRRQILAAVAGSSLVAVGAGPVRAASGLAPVELNQSAQIQAGDSLPAVALDWRETVNGVVTEDTGLAAVPTESTGDVGLVVDEAVLPGDTGAVTLRATLVDGGEGETVGSAELTLLFSLTETAENGLTEPEREANDTTPTVGELQDAAEIEIWNDMGIGTGNGGNEDIPFLTDGDDVIASGTLAAVADDPAFADGGYGLTRDGESCLTIGEAVYVSFRWTIPTDAGNVIQSDSARFTVGFAARRCRE